MKKIIILLTLILCYIPVFAQLVHPNVAVEIIESYINGGNRENSVKVSLEEISFFGVAPIYCIRAGNKTFFMASDRRIPPIIAEIDGIIDDINVLPDPFLDYLQMYESAIQYVIQNNHIQSVANEKWLSLDSLRQSNSSTSFDEIIVSPLLVKNGLEVHWGQSDNNDINWPDSSKVYNLMCPLVAGGPHGHALVGCVAVAMAQLMWYWEWPASIASSKLSYVPNYDWNSMPTNIYNSTSQYIVNQVAGLLSDCGKTVNMSYSANASSAYMSDCRNALKNDFAYSTNITSIPYSASNETVVINELRNGHPIIADGRSQGSSSGHAFVVDGYKVVGSDNLIHINWGWCGNYNGGYSSGYGTGTPTYLLPSTWVRIGDIVVKNSIGDTVAYYNYNENFTVNITPKYPLCNDITINNVSLSNNFSKYNGGKITISNQIVQPNKKGYFLSEREVRLLPCTQLKQGSKVLIGIRDMNCSSVSSNNADLEDEEVSIAETKMNSRKSESDKVANNISLSVFEDKLMVFSDSPIVSVDIFDVNGLKVLQTSGNELSLSKLTQGLYIAVASNQKGQQTQSTFIR